MDKNILEILLHDKTTGKNIIWANAERDTDEISVDDVERIQARHNKNRADQKFRTRTRAEIFTPPEVCEIQNNLVCEPFNNDWQKFIDAKFLEITCGEAPYITNRYNAVTGEPIPIDKRVGLLDMKLSTINTETKSPADCRDFTIRALKSVYGYEFQGDNLFLARRNIFLTVEEFLTGKINMQTLKEILPIVAEIISWNFFQMDGLTNSPPFTESANLFGGANCRIKDWNSGEVVEFCSLIKGGNRR